MPPQKFHSLAETLLSTVRSGIELYTKWYQSQQQARRKRKRISDEDNAATTSFVSVSATSNDPPAVCLDASSTESSSSGDAQQPNKRQKIEQDKNDPSIPRFKLGTCVRKHFPIEGWFDGEVVKGHWDDAFNQWVYYVDFEQREEQGFVTEDELADIVFSGEPYRDPTLYTFEEFLVLWERLKPEDIEKSSAIRRANTKVASEDSGSQHNAQYGRFLPEATDTLFKILRLKRSDIFLDVGHGIGNSCLQAAYCAGCESRGIEVVRDRFNISLDFENALREMTRWMDKQENRTRLPGKIILRHGDLSDPARHNWLARANKIFVNNFNGVFAERMVPQEASSWHLDHYIAGLFASMEEEAIMFTLADLQLGPTQKEVNKWRVDNNLEPSPNASFFDVVKVELGEAGKVFSWSSSCKAPAYAFVYRRVKQDPARRTATLLCCNIQCEHSRKGTPIPAVAINREGKAVVGTCECKMTLRSNRRLPSITVAEFLDPKGEYSDWGL